LLAQTFIGLFLQDIEESVVANFKYLRRLMHAPAS